MKKWVYILKRTDFFHKLLIIYFIYFIILAINPYDRKVWFVENAIILIIVFILILTYRKFKFSNTSYILMFVLIFMHTLGGHYTFARVPFDWFNSLFGFERNMYDRIAHFSVGFYAYAIAEFLEKINASNKKWIIYLFPITFIMALAAGYEIFEWQFAVFSDPKAGIEVLGSQGDIWDAQKDMLLDTLGAIFSMLLYIIKKKNKSK